MTDTAKTQIDISELIKNYEKNCEKTIDKALEHFKTLKDIKLEDDNLDSKIEIISYGNNKLHYKLKRIVETIKFKNKNDEISEELKKKYFTDTDSNYYLMNEKKPDVLPFENCILYQIFECNVNNNNYEDNLDSIKQCDNNDKEKIINLYKKINEKKKEFNTVETNKSDFNDYLIENTNIVRKNSNDIVIKKFYCIGKVIKEDNELKLKYYRVKQSENNSDNVTINFVDINT